MKQAAMAPAVSSRFSMTILPIFFT